MNIKFEAFTLLEILVVLTIIGILLAIAMPNYNRIQNSAMISAAKTEMNGFNIAIYNYKLDKGILPSNVDDLLKEGYITKDMATDPWNHKYVLEKTSDGNMKVVSLGPDGKLNTKDDIKIDISY